MGGAAAPRLQLLGAAAARAPPLGRRFHHLARAAGDVAQQRSLARHDAAQRLPEVDAVVVRQHPRDGEREAERDEQVARAARRLALAAPLVEVERRLLAAAPGAAEVLERLEAENPPVDEVLLDGLPISIYGGG